MPNPFRKHSHSRSAKRRGGNRQGPPPVSRCGNCEAVVLPHRVCAACGYYGGRPAVIIKQAKDKK